MDKPWRVIGVDIGWSNLAMVVADVDRETREVNVVHAVMQDLRRIRCKDDACMFERSDKKEGHLVHHFVESQHEWLSTANKILIEHQPICSSHKGVEQSLFIYCKQRYSNGNKSHVQLMSPNSMHAHFKMSCEKVERRVEIVEISEPYLRDLMIFKRMKQKDHLGDAFGYILFYTQTRMEKEMWGLTPNRFELFKFRAM